MRRFAYNGDADGICSMVQWGLMHGVTGERVTGVKRDIELLERKLYNLKLLCNSSE